MLSRPLCGSEHTNHTLVDTCSQRYGGHGERETPGNIPNPEAKPLSADGTAPGTGWESRTPPDILLKRGSELRAPAPVFALSGISLHCSRRIRPRSMRYPEVMTAPRRGSGGSSSRRGGPQGGGSRGGARGASGAAGGAQ